MFNNSILSFFPGDPACSETYKICAYNSSCSDCSSSLYMYMDPTKRPPPGFALTRSDSQGNYVCYKFGWNSTSLVSDFRGKVAVTVFLTNEEVTNRVYKYYDRLDLVLMTTTCRYCVAPSQSLSDVAALYGTTVSNLRMANPMGLEDMTNADARLNQSLPINVGVVYRVMPGDYFDLLARRFYMTLSQILQVNSGISNNVLQPGDELCIVPSICKIKCNYPAQCTVAV
mmetsp:Transcript_25343/g.83830  ORF Transcript_25343/g.83830 Transcript_25343/m.83830 type:complete len:228 (-) Transcript_25343:760-1443(-)